MNEKKFEEKYLKKGYKVIRKGYPDFIFYKEDKNNKISDVQFIEYKFNDDRLRKEQLVFKKIAKILKLNYKIIRERDTNKKITTMMANVWFLRFLNKFRTGRESWQEIIMRLITSKKLNPEESKKLKQEIANYEKFL